MENYVSSGQTNNRLITDLTNELALIEDMKQQSVRQTESLLRQISMCEARFEYIDAALAESQRIAGEITSDAEQRVGKIVYNAQKIVMPHQEMITCLNREISQLTEEIAVRDAARREAVVREVMDIPESKSSEELDNENSDILVSPIEPEPETAAMSEKPAVKRQFSMREPQEEIEAVLPEIPHNSAYTPEPQSNLRWQYSMSSYQFSRNHAHSSIETETSSTQSETALTGKRQYSLREPQDWDTVDEQPVMPSVSEPAVVPEAEVRAQYSMIRPQSLATLEPVEIAQEVLIEEVEEINLEALVEEVLIDVQAAENVGIEPLTNQPVQLNETRFDLDVTLTLRYFDVNDQSRSNQIRPTWQAKVVVDVPRENEAASYGKAFSAVTSTLYRYDDVVLNDVYPFDLIAPGTENIGMYFFNCLDDCLSFMDLNLKEISLWDHEEQVIKIDKRNPEFDKILLKGEDILEDIRSKVTKKQNSLVKDPSRGLLGSLFRN